MGGGYNEMGPALLLVLFHTETQINFSTFTNVL